MDILIILGIPYGACSIIFCFYVIFRNPKYPVFEEHNSSTQIIEEKGEKKLTIDEFKTSSTVDPNKCWSCDNHIHNGGWHGQCEFCWSIEP